MAPTFYHYSPVWSMEGQGKEGKRRLWLSLGVGALITLTFFSLITALLVCAVRDKGEACQSGLQAESECFNVTHLLQDSLTRAQEGLLKVETQALTCNQTLVTLKTSLEEQQAQNQEQQARIWDLERDIITLNQTLQDTLAELEQLRKEKETSRQVPSVRVNSASSRVASSLSKSLMLLVLLLLGALML